ncbi:MAG: Spy/CpxP family protein refolding chaperone [Mangrovibacterium sp.]
MKKVFLALAIIVGFSSMAMAQRGTGTRPSQSSEYQRRAPGGERMSPEERVAKEVERMTKQLNLTTDQQAKVKTVLEADAKEMQTQMQAMREKMGDDPEAMREQMESNRDAMRQQMEARRKAQETKIKAILTDEQKVAYDKMQSERQQRMRDGGGRGERPAIGHPDE